jgi:hypothetical protein
MHVNRTAEHDALAIVVESLDRSLEILPRESTWRGCLLETRMILRANLGDDGPMSHLVDGEDES